MQFPKMQTLRRHFTPFEVPMTQAFRQLREANLLACKVPMEGYKPKKYDPNARCEYHMGQAGHSTEHCWRLKNKIQDMIDARIIQLDFLEANGLTSSSNSLLSLFGTSSRSSSSSSTKGLFLLANKLAQHLK